MVELKWKGSMETLSLEHVLKILVSFGFTPSEARVYVYLAKMGPQTSRGMTTGLRVTSQQLTPILINLQKKGVVISNFKYQALFSALTIEKVLDIQVKKTVNQAKSIKEAKEELLTSWRNMETTRNNN